MLVDILRVYAVDSCVFTAVLFTAVDCLSAFGVELVFLVLLGAYAAPRCKVHDKIRPEHVTINRVFC